MSSQNTILRFSAEDLWFTSDTHFGCENIIRFCGRPFKSAAEMDEELICRWNDTVPEDGIIFHLGDFCQGRKKEWESILKRLHGHKYLILGNHDMTYSGKGAVRWFEQVAQQMTIRVGAQTILLNHNPFLCYGGAYRDTWQLFGHVHSGPLSKTGLDHPRLKMLFPRQYDVGVDNNDFRPVSFREVRAKIEAQVIAARETSGMLMSNHHDGTYRVAFVDPDNPMPEAVADRLNTLVDDIIAVSPQNGHSLKEMIAVRVALFPGNVRFVYIGAQVLEDFRAVPINKGASITQENIDTAIQILTCL